MYTLYTCVLQTVGGNIMTASPVSDLNPLFMAAGITLNFSSKGMFDYFVKT